jgi:anthranilate synthase component 1
MIPSRDAFRAYYENYDRVPVYRRLLSDALTPVSAFQLLQDASDRQHLSGSCLFESVIGGEKVGRYSLIAVQPTQRIYAYGGETHVETAMEGPSGIEIERNRFQCDDPLEHLNKLLGKPSVAPVPDLPPFIGGAIGYAGYDVVRYVELLPNPPPDDRCLPDLDFSFYDRIVVFDNVTKTMIVIAMVDTYQSPDADRAYDLAQARIDAMVARLSRPGLPQPAADAPQAPFAPLPIRSNFTQPQFEDAVRHCNEYIVAGDIFQVVISQRFEMPFEGDAFEIYRSLRVINPSPFMFYLRTPTTTLVGASPEVMCRVWDGVVTVRPLAGTRPRGKDDEEDRALAAELLADPKERAEHVMLVDLGRNDVGRVAAFGSVQLSDVMCIERYSHVMHISSNVQGRLRTGTDAMDAMKACLPAGTVSGAPKVRAMEIIDEIEPTRRGPYAGAVGYLDYRGNMDTCIALRTMVVKDDKVYIQAGAGLVADSDPAAEYQETVNKSRAMVRAVEATVARLNRTLVRQRGEPEKSPSE